METKVILEKQDLTYLKWSHIRNSSGTAGSFLKSQSTINGKKKYYKLSNYEEQNGIVGHECINEIIVDRLLTILGVTHLHYQLIYADIEVNEKVISTYLCVSEDFKERGESKVALDALYQTEKVGAETPYEFCRRMGFADYIDMMLAIDYIILNRDRHGANIEVLRNARKHTFRIAPYFDHGISLMFHCHTDEEIKAFDIMNDVKCNNFIGTKSTLENLSYLSSRKVFKNKLKDSDKEYVFKDLDTVITKSHKDCLWKMIMERYQYYENI